MSTIKRFNLLQIISLFLLLGVVGSCIDDRYIVPVSKENTVTFSVKVPGSGAPTAAGPKTRALDVNEENVVNQIAVLLFDIDGVQRTYTYQPIYCSSSNIITDPSNSEIKTFTIKVPVGKYDMVVLANANQSLSGIVGKVGQSKDVVLENLLVTNSGKWNTSSSTDDYIPIPMWGEVKGKEVKEGMDPNTPVLLIRMVSKIDVVITSFAKAKFSLESVRLFNYNDKGRVAPNMAYWSSTDGVVIAPSIPSGAEKPSPAVSNSLLYEESAIFKDAGKGVSVTNEIYTFETTIGEASSLPTNTCLVVGGKYDQETESTFYRVDLANTTGSTVTYLPLLRNHNYKVNIADISASGFPSPAAAFNSPPVNIKASVLNWNESEVANVEFDGQYMLGVSQGEFSLSSNPRFVGCEDNSLTITTDVPSGWELTKIVDEEGSNINSVTNLTTGWLEVLTVSTGNSGATTYTKLILSENDTGSPRTGLIHISAGRLTYIVKVIQSKTSKVDIKITNASNQVIDVLEFISKKDVQPDSKQFKLEWFPKSSDIFFTNINITQENPFSFDTGFNVIPASGVISNPLGTQTYTIRPTAITTANLESDPFYKRNSMLFYTISDGTLTVNKTLILRQSAYNAHPVVSNYYLMDGTQKSFNVRSNTPFTVSVKTNPNNVITNLITTSGGANTSASGTPVYFVIKNDMSDPALFFKEIVVTIASPTNLFPAKDVTLTCISGIIQPESNSYIMTPGGASILIPVSRANKSLSTWGLGEQLGLNDAYTAELIWTDNIKGLTFDSNIEIITPIGKGSLSHIFVRPGTGQGNALIAIKKDGIILWSWHIWVVTDTPKVKGTKNLMDCNLGALQKTSGNQNVNGFYYQWGRKDPFPGGKVVYNSSGVTYSMSISSFPKGVNNFPNSFTNPTKYYFYNDADNSKNSHDWIGDTDNQRSNLWSDGPDKTVYDPCPVGWRVPGIDVFELLSKAKFPWGTNGRTNDDYGGYYPAAKEMNGLGEFQTDGWGYYWSAVPYLLNGKDFRFRQGILDSRADTGDGNRDRGRSIRCVKE